MKYKLKLTKKDMFSILQNEYPLVMNKVNLRSVEFTHHRRDYFLTFFDHESNYYKLSVFACGGQVPAILECEMLDMYCTSHVDLLWMYQCRMLQAVS